VVKTMIHIIYTPHHQAENRMGKPNASRLVPVGAGYFGARLANNWRTGSAAPTAPHSCWPVRELFEPVPLTPITR